METTIKQLRELRANLPKGKKDPFTNCCRSKRVLLNRALNKERFIDLTEGELDAVNLFLVHCRKLKAADERFAATVAKITRPTNTPKP